MRKTHMSRFVPKNPTIKVSTPFSLKTEVTGQQIMP